MTTANTSDGTGSAGVPAESLVHHTRFLLVDSSNSALEKLERYLLMEAAAKVYMAKTPLLALRILQDRRTPVDCVICADRLNQIAGLEFLQNLRTGRYGGKSLNEIKFILVTQQKNDDLVQIADSYRVNGYIVGELERTSVMEEILKVLAQAPTETPGEKIQIAHVHEQGVDLIIVPFDQSFGEKPLDEQQQILDAVQTAAAHSGLKGTVVPVWDTGGGGMGFIAPKNYSPYFQTLSMDFVRSNLNRELCVSNLPKPAEANETVVPLSISLPSGRPDAAGDGASKRTTDDRDAQESAVAKKNLPPLTIEHVHKVAAAFKQMGPEKFSQAFVRRQPLIVRQPNGNFKPLMTEYYVGVDLLRKPFFGDADLRHCGNVFTDLTLLLDQIVMRSFEHLPGVNEPFSINLNIQSVFTKTFETFLPRISAELMTVEFRQGNIVEYFDEFQVAKSLLRSKGAKVAADQIFPDTLGLVNLEYVGVAMAKFHWAADAGQALRERNRAVKYMLESGITPVMTRVDENQALVVGGEMGVETFQGYLIDELLRKRAA